MPLTLIRRQSLPHSHCTNCSPFYPLHFSLSLCPVNWQTVLCKLPTLSSSILPNAIVIADCRLPTGDCIVDCILKFSIWLPPCQLASQIGHQWASLNHTHSLAIYAKNSCAMNGVDAVQNEAAFLLQSGAGNNWCAYWQLQLQLVRNVTANEISSKLTS